MDEYGIYLRKSRVDAEAEAHGAGDTLSRHRAALVKLANARGLTVTGYYEEVRSGESIAARPEMQRLLNDVEDGKWAGVLVMEVERLARGNTTDQGIVADTFKYTNTKIITPVKTYDPNDEFDEEYFEFGLFMSRREYKTINRRLQRGRRASLSEGKYIAGKAAYGYERFKLPKEKGYTLRIIPEQAEVVRQIFDWYVNGARQPDGTVRQLGAPAIAKKLDAQGIPSPTAGKWPACTITEIIKNPTYIGKIRWSHRPTIRHMVDGEMLITRPVSEDASLSDGLHDAIIEESLWGRAQTILKMRSHTPVPKRSRIQNPLAGLIFCSKCGCSMERRKYQRGRDCLICPNKDCNCVSSILEDVESSVLEVLRLWLAEYRVKIAAAKNPGDDLAHIDQIITRLRQSSATLQKQLDSLYDLLEQGVYTADVFRRRSQTLTGKIETVCQELARAEQAALSEQRLQHSHFELVPQIEHVLSIYPALNDAREKNELLKAVLTKVVYTKTQGGRWAEGDMNLFIFPKIETDAPLHHQ